jgi:hypothetical protein
MKPAIIVTTMVLVINALWLSFLHFLPTTHDALWIDGLYRKKENAAQLIGERKKIVLIGGSGVHFGLSAGLIAETTGLPTVNFGIHAALGAHYILHRSQHILRPGDIGILSLEHVLLDEGWKPNFVLADYVNAIDWRYLLHSPARDLLPLFFGTSPIRLLRDQALRFRPPIKGLYKIDTVTEDGDETGNRVELVTPAIREAVLREYPWQPFSRVRSSLLQEFAAQAGMTGVTLFYVWPPMMDRPIYREPRYREFFSGLEELYKEAGFTTLGSVYDALYPPEAMFDTTFHLNASSAKVHTEALGRRLCAHIVCKPS